MIERFVPGRELTCGVLGDEALTVGEIVPEAQRDFRLPEQVSGGRRGGTFPGRPDARADRRGEAALGARSQGVEAERLQPVGFPSGPGRGFVVPGGQHVAGHDGDEPAAAIRAGGGDRVRGVVRAHLSSGGGAAGESAAPLTAASRFGVRRLQDERRADAAGLPFPRSQVALGNAF